MNREHIKTRDIVPADIFAVVSNQDGSLLIMLSRDQYGLDEEVLNISPQDVERLQQGCVDAIARRSVIR